jgi:molybdopterin molybdotransferase
VLLHAGVIISPAEVALMASVGLHKASVYGFPKTAVISTGDELVDVSVVPEPHQIRKSNSFALVAAMKRLGWEASSFYLTDHENIVRETLSIILSENDLIIISGGVSRGKFDFIPAALESLGVKKLFHQVKQRPGKPFWFGASPAGKVVFALPGNPVSTYLCFYKYIAPWILANFKADPNTWSASLDEDFTFEPEFTYFLQVRTESKSGILTAHPLPGGSGDFVNLRNIDGFLELPMERTTFKHGEAFPYIPFRV